MSHENRRKARSRERESKSVEALLASKSTNSVSTIASTCVWSVVHNGSHKAVLARYARSRQPLALRARPLCEFGLEDGDIAVLAVPGGDHLYLEIGEESEH